MKGASICGFGACPPSIGGGGGGPGAPPNTILILATLKGVFKCILIDQGKNFGHGRTSPFNFWFILKFIDHIFVFIKQGFWKQTVMEIFFC